MLFWILGDFKMRNEEIGCLVKILNNHPYCTQEQDCKYKSETTYVPVPSKSKTYPICKWGLEQMKEEREGQYSIVKVLKSVDGFKARKKRRKLAALVREASSISGLPVNGQ